jgi:sugar phosphate isomerase/epimerase
MQEAARRQVHIVQIADNLPLHELTGTELDRLRETAVGLGVKLEVGTRGLDPAHLSRYIAVAERIGARTLRTVLSGSRGGPKELSAAEAGLRQILPQLEGRDIVLALENNEVFAAAEYAALMKKIAVPSIGICMDTANSLGRPELLDTVLHHLAGHTVMLHAKDYDIRRVDTRMGFSVVGTPVGKGRVDFDAVLASLREVDRDPASVIVEHWPPFECDIAATVRTENEWLERSLAFLRPRVEP